LLRSVAEQGWGGFDADAGGESGKFFDEFDWYMRAMKAEREKGLPY
jgi:hypothetical protein